MILKLILMVEKAMVNGEFGNFNKLNAEDTKAILNCLSIKKKTHEGANAQSCVFNIVC